MKVCKKCGQNKDSKEFFLCSKNKDKLHSCCISCHRKWLERIAAEKAAGVYVSKKGKPRLTVEQRAKRAEELALWKKEYRIKNKDAIARRKKLSADQAKIDGIAAYGGKCTCCGESKFEFLTLEHINGREKDKQRMTGKKAWLHLKANGWPTGHTVLCFNCNCAKGAYGSCPHTWEQK